MSAPKRVQRRTQAVFICTSGCCNGCSDCYGYAIGCHQDPCRCAEPCTGWETEVDMCVGPCPRHRPEQAA